MLPQVFPSAAEKARMDHICKLTKLYKNESFSVLGLHDLIKKQFKDDKQIVYISHSIPAKVSEFYGDFVLGDVTDCSIESTSDNEAEVKAVEDAVDNNDLKESVFDFGVSQSSIGFFVLHTYLDAAGDIIIRSVPQDQCFKQPDGSFIFATCTLQPGKTDGTKKDNLWWYLQHYQIENNSVVIDRSLWTVNDRGEKKEQVSLALYDANLPEREVIKNLAELPIVQIDNLSCKDGYGKSDIEDIIPQLSEVNERTTHVAIQLLKNLDAKLTGPRGMLDENQVPKQWEVMERDTNDQPKPEYVLNENPLIAETYRHVEKQLTYISWFTAVPMFELLSTSANPERVESLRMRMFSAVRRTMTKRAKIRKGLCDIMRVALLLKGFTEPAKVRVEFSDVLPSDPLVNAQVEQIKITNGLSSRRSSIKRLENMDDEEVDEELVAIEQENTVAGISPNLPPKLPTDA